MIQKTPHDQKDDIPATLEAFERLINCEQPYHYELTRYDLRTRSGIITKKRQKAAGFSQGDGWRRKPAESERSPSLDRRQPLCENTRR
ncbi:hypothetical protein EI42_04107 [Thermosporothrix hazakensis]|jgi:hypothetical protein|uniref:Uncharacterized protein n=1 Tax=Thermosporothrix hazakensis TaxID=644383 RepID=A0A326U304_THEHA|nr:hypothetical protein [Thermosporothrix hazakensis]PZW26148.1 hypothetical protein EI42_04107 [Thermosporothrix hazakensis]GCE51408.1 hypothetical protein KTH_62770 [Thermosporothrix hazakensis]